MYTGKYTNSYCGGSRTEAIALSGDFTIVNRDIDRQKCMEMLLESQLSADCESIKGKYNLAELVKKRRALLPDCCLVQFFFI